MATTALTAPNIDPGGAAVDVDSIKHSDKAPSGTEVTADNSGLSYSDKLKVNVRIEERLKRDVLEIHLENENSTNINLSDEVVATLCSRIGIDVKSHVEGAQIMPGRTK